MRSRGSLRAQLEGTDRSVLRGGEPRFADFQGARCRSSGSYGSTSMAPANVTRADVAFPLAALSGGMATMRSWIDHAGEVVWEPAPLVIAQLVEAGQPFWLDIEDPTDELIDQLATRLGLHPLAVEDSKQFGQRAKLQVYGNGVMLVGFGLDEQLRKSVEVHCYCTTGFLITLRRAPSPALDALRQAGSVQPQLGSDPIRAPHRRVQDREREPAGSEWREGDWMLAQPDDKPSRPENPQSGRPSRPVGPRRPGRRSSAAQLRSVTGRIGFGGTNGRHARDSVRNRARAVR